MPDPGWLQLLAEESAVNEEYIEMNNIIMDLSVTNDTAERAVGKVTDYANSAQDGGQ